MQKYEKKRNPSLRPSCEFYLQLKFTTVAKKIVLLPLDSGSKRLIGNPVKIRSYARSCKFSKRPATLMSLTFVGKTLLV